MGMCLLGRPASKIRRSLMRIALADPHFLVAAMATETSHAGLVGPWRMGEQASRFGLDVRGINGSLEDASAAALTGQSGAGLRATTSAVRPLVQPSASETWADVIRSDSRVSLLASCRLDAMQAVNINPCNLEVHQKRTRALLRKATTYLVM